MASQFFLWNFISFDLNQSDRSHRKLTQVHASPGQTESQVDPSFHLASKVHLHTYPDIFESATFFFWIQLPSTRIQRTRQRIRIYKLRVDRGIFEFAKKKLRIKRYPDTCGWGLKRIYFSSFDFPIS